MYRFRRSPALVAFALLLGGTPRIVQAQNATPAAPKPISAEGYTRAIKNTSGQISGVQTAIRRLAPAKEGEPTVYLVAVTHVGEKGYYGELQKLLDKQDLVLFEGVRPGKEDAAKDLATRKAESEKAQVLQRRLSKQLGVVFQLDGINYKHENFKNSDLSWDDLYAAAKQSGTDAQLGNLQAMLKGSAGPEAGMTGTMMKQFLDMAEQNPAIAQMFRQLIVTAVADPAALQRMAASAGGGAASTKAAPVVIDQKVLIEARNKAVIEDFKKASPQLRSGASVALFYGAGHMNDLEQRLKTELGYKPAETRWLTAISMAAPAAAK
ncbi:MAG: hypothetical protein QM758_21750 [Armatimonas sp.]